MQPLITIVINFYNNEREAPRSLYTLSAAYQRGVTENDYKIIAIDNGSPKPLKEEQVLKFGSNFTYYNFKSKHPSPCEAINFGINKADTPFVMCLIDGAHMLSPRVVDFTIKAIRAYDNPAIFTLPLHFGPYMQFYSVMHGYNQKVEDSLLESIPWVENGYSLFTISNMKNYERNFFSPLYESNCFTVKKSEMLRHGSFSEKFISSGGGLVNLDIFKKLVEDESIQNVTLVGEASFHQYHGGVTTNQAKKHQPLPAFKKEYKDIYGVYFSGATYVSEYIGIVTPESSDQIPKQRWHIYRNIATVLTNRKKFAQAISVLNLAKEQHPNRLQLYMQLANIHEKNQDFKNAELNYKKAIEISPANEIDQYVNLGILYLYNGEEELGKKCLQKAAILEPDSAKITANLAKYYIEKGEKPKALVQLELASDMITRRRAPQNIYMSMAQSYRKLKKFDRGIESLDHLLKINSSNSNGHFLKAILLMQSRQYDAAEKSFQKSLACNYRDPIKIRTKLVELYQLQGKIIESLNECYQIKLLDPDSLFNIATIKKLSDTLKAERKAANYDSIIFTHIPKCGGMSFRKFFLEGGLKSGIAKESIWTPGLNDINIIHNIQVLGMLGELIEDDKVIIADHSYYNIHEVYNLKTMERPFYATIIREPYERFISAYYYFYFERGEDGLKGIDLNDLPADRFKKVLEKEGLQLTRYLGDYKIDAVSGEEITMDHAKNALKNLITKYATFGIFEEMNTSLQLILNQLPSWLNTKFELPNSNKSATNLNNLNIRPELKKEIETYIAPDVYLYAKAKEAFFQRIAN